MKKNIRKIISLLFSLLPSNAPEFIYTRVLKPWPLRQVTNSILHKIIPEKITLEEGKIFLNKKDPVVSGALALGVYEKDMTEIFKSVLKKGMVVLDIGANVGYYTIISSYYVGKSGKVLSFEPEPENYKFLTKNINANEYSNVLTFPCGISDKKSEGTLYLSSDNKGKHSLIKLKGEDTSINIPLTTIDSVLADSGIEKIDVIKIDIEGAEALALKGMTNTIKKNPPCILFCEFYPEALRLMHSDPLDFLHNISSLGFSIYEIRNQRKQLVSSKDFHVFVTKFKKDEYTNLYCIKSETF